MKRVESDSCRAWQLLIKFFFAQRAHLPSSDVETGLSPVQCHVLHILEPGGALPMGRLAKTLSCDASNVTGLIDRMEARGLVRRESSPADRRVKVLRLTAAGSRVRSQLLSHVTQHPNPLSKLSHVQQRTLAKILEALVEDAT